MASDAKKSEEAKSFEVDWTGWVTARFPDGGTLKTQTVEAHLLLAILKELRGISRLLETP